MKIRFPVKKNHEAFTLIELLTVIAIIGILAGILIPVAASVRDSANKSKTKVQMNQWVSAMELFKQEYGYYPNLAASGKKIDAEYFVGALTGKKLNGDDYTATTEPRLAGNKKMLAFFSISSGDLNTEGTKLVDAFGNEDFVFFRDVDNDGIIKQGGSDGLTLESVNAIDGTVLTPSAGTSGIDLTNGVRAGVIIYSAGKGTKTSDIIYSWQ